jgi:hypothetical protein
MAAASLDERVAVALKGEATSGEIEHLVEEVQAAVISAGKAAETAKAQALDPALPVGAVATARHAIEDQTFRRQRLEIAGKRLRHRLLEAREQEEEARRIMAYHEAQERRDGLAAELANAEDAILKLAHLLVRIEASDRELRRVNLGLPRGAAHLSPVFAKTAPPAVALLFREAVAREALVAVARAAPNAAKGQAA